MHKSTIHPTGGAVNIKMSRRGAPTPVRSDGTFLKLGEIHVPILSKGGGSLPAALIGREYEAATAAATDWSQPIRLWTNPVVDAGAAPPTLPPRVRPILLLEVGPIPQRIARLIAEDAVNRGETCAITMDDIDVGTAAVTTCFHVFDAAAIKNWFIANTSCPVCRARCAIQVASGTEITGRETQ
jgi:hypothetical protein